MEIFETLNPPQLEAVKNTEGPLLVLAGAGSGKTRVITIRIAYLIAEKNIPPYNILAVTFTNKAAGEMRERVEALLENQKLQSAPLISTFHSLCVRILRADIEHLDEGFTKTFTIYDTDDTLKVLKACTKDLGLDEKQLTPRSVYAAISAAKNRGEDYEMYAARVESADEKRASIARIFRAYVERLENSNALDFDDLLIKTVRLLRKSEATREKYNNRYKYILVDEYQDTNSLQFALIKFLTEKQQNICVVGDDAQSIYGFRGADVQNILQFESHFPQAQVIMLEQNYRSTQTILDAADAIIKNNISRKEKKLWTKNSGGEKAFYFQAFDAEGEARFVASMIEKEQMSSAATKFAILYRTNSQSRQFEEALRRMRIDYNLVGGFSFYERAEVKDIIAYLKLALNPFDDIALLRVINTPSRGLGKTSLDELQFQARQSDASIWETIARILNDADSAVARLTSRALNALKDFREVIGQLHKKTAESSSLERPVSDVVVAAIELTGYANELRLENSDEANARLENLEELVNAAVEYDKSEGGLRDFIDHAALVSDTDKYDRNASVTMMTIHAAKGLEFPTVFLVGLEDGIFPHSRSVNDPKQLEEERRLAYVAITRAEKRLYLTHSMRRRIYGEEMAAEPSQFLNELPLELIEDLSQGPSWLSYAREGNSQLSRSAPEMRTPSIQTEKPRKLYTGKTYNNAEAIADFFKARGLNASKVNATEIPAENDFQESKTETAEEPERRPSSGWERLKAASSREKTPSHLEHKSENSDSIVPGVHVRHLKYGRGLVLRREGSGDNVKLTVSFPGFGQKKLIEKFANLERIT